MKRLRAPKAKSGELLAQFGKDAGETDVFYCFPTNDCGMRRDARMLGIAFERTDLGLGNGSLRKELESRGYDIETLKFSIKKKVAQSCPP